MQSGLPALEGRVQLRSLEDWIRWKELNPQRGLILETVVNRIRQQGFIDPTVGHVQPGDIVAWDALREGLRAAGLCSRQRAVLRALYDLGARNDSRIFGAEAVTPFALRLRGRFAYYLGSEYGATPEARKGMFPIPHQDLTALDLPEAAFDFVITNEVLEHVPDLDAALRSIARILRPEGRHLGTVPFLYENREGTVKARLVNGHLQHLTQPEYHGNPFAEGGSLVFELPGWNILDRAREAGFADAFMEFMWSAKHGIVTEGLGVFILNLRR